MDKKKILIFIVFALLVNLTLVYQLDKNERKINKLQGTYIAEKQIEVFKNIMDDYIYSTEALEILLLRNNYGGKDFERIAQGIYLRQDSIKGVQMAPEGVVKYSYPYEENKEGMVDLFKSPKRRTEVEYSRDTGKLTLTGPFSLRQGGEGMIIRNPIYQEDGVGNKKFWGFTILILNFEKLMDESRFQELADKGYNYRICKEKLIEDTYEYEMVQERGEMKDPLRIDFQVVESKWHIEIEPVAGWNDPVQKMTRYLFILGMMSFILYSLNKILLKKKIEKQLTEEQVLNKCISLLYQQGSLEDSISKLLEVLTMFYRGERAYIFEYSEGVFHNTHKWSVESRGKEEKRFTDIRGDIIEWWIPIFNDKSGFRIGNIEKELDHTSSEYLFFKSKEINAIVTTPLFDRDGGIKGFIGIDNPRKNIKNSLLVEKVARFIGDFLERDELIKKLDILSFTDRLTGVKNYHAYAEALDSLKADPEESLGISYFDINGLKAVNDTQGHERGDQLIIACGEILKKHFGDRIYRIGGDEFVLLYRGIDSLRFEEEMAYFKSDLEGRPFNMSYGFRWYEDSRDIQKKVRDVDQLMYHEKFNYYMNK